MFGWFKKAKLEAPKLPFKKNGFFSTEEDFNFNLDGEDEGNIARASALDRSFQRKVTDVRAVAPDGTGMDSAYPDLTQVKLQNTLFGYLPDAQLGWYAGQGFIGYQTCAMISQNWLIDKACTMPARDALRNGFEITVNDGTKVDPEVLDYMRRLDKKYNIKGQCVELLRMGRIFGIRVALFEVASPDPNYYTNPFNIDGVTPGSYKGIAQIDPYWVTPELDAQAASNPASRHFYEPTWWRINGRRVHRSHLVIMRNGGELPDILKPTYFYGGIPVPQKIFERVYAAERTANEAPMLAMSKRLTVLNIDISQAVADMVAFTRKMMAWMSLQNNFGAKIVGEGEKIEQFDTSLADLDAVIMTQYQIVSAGSDVPATKLLGTSPKGFGASGDYEKSSYREFLESLQESDLTPLVERHHMLIIKSEILPKFPAIVPFSTTVLWKSTDTPTAKEQAEVNLLKSQADNQLVQAGAVDGTDVRGRIIKEPDSGYNGIPEIVPGGPGDREAQQEAEAALEQPIQESNKGKSGGGENEQ